MTIKKRDFEEWMESPVTEEFFKVIEGRIGELKEGWAKYSLTNDKLWQEDRARFLRTEILARIATFEEVLEADYFEEDDDNSDHRIQSSS